MAARVVAAAIGCLVLAGAIAASPAAAERPPTARAFPGLAPTPPMGWNDWNAFGCRVDAELVKATADILIETGMRDAGYRYVNIDDCWMTRSRDAAGNLVPDSQKFPGGIREVADYVHARGLKLGIYEDAGAATCEGYPGSLGHEREDAASFAAWGIDYLKYDNCHNRGLGGRAASIKRYTTMRDALDATGRPIVLSICEWGESKPWTWAPGMAELWRTTHDIKDTWPKFLRNFTQNVPLAGHAGPNGWNDPDMLEVGNGGMTTAEYRAQFSLWAVMAAPLIAGADLRTITPEQLAIYLNHEVIAVDQDALGRQGAAVAVGGQKPGAEARWVLVKPLANGDRAIVLFNAGEEPATLAVTAGEAGLPTSPSYVVRDLWSGETAVTVNRISVELPPHASAMFRVSATFLAPTGPSLVE